jgi:hypothetical protein
MDLSTGKNMEPNLGNFNLRNLSEDERAALRACDRARSQAELFRCG